MVCPYCQSKTKVTNSRAQTRLNAVWRRRLCKKCSAIVTSQENLDYATVWLVENKSNSIPFSRDKLFLSILGTIPKSQKSVENAAMLTDTVIKSLLKLRVATLDVNDIATSVENTLSKYNALSALKYVSERSSLYSKRDVARKLKSLPLN